jgi:signal transduction histidine kinase
MMANQAAEAILGDSRERPHILVMEDETSVAEGLQMVLKEEGYGVDLAMTGHGALDTLNQKGVDLLVADLRLPDIDGMEVINRVRHEQPQTEVLVITGYATVPSAVEAMKRGAVNYLPKPFTDEQFMAAVEDALKKEEAPVRGHGESHEAIRTRLIEKREVIQVLKGSSHEFGAMPHKCEAPVIDLEKESTDQAGLLQQHKMISLGRLAASVVHEINNPLAGILNYLRLMIKILNRDSPSREQKKKFQRYLDLVASEIGRCSKIVSNLLAFSRKSNMEFGDVNLLELLEKSIMLSQHKLDLQNIKLIADFNPAVPTVWGDFNQIQQCVINLIFNAIDAMPDGGMLTVECAKDTGNKMVKIRVRDTGSGISDEDLPHVFEPFFTTKAEGSGLGLGLSTVYGIIDRHKGTIGVESEVGKGSVFTLKLPVSK